MNKLKVGLIGVGGIANYKHMPSMQKLNDKVEMVAFCDLIRERAEAGAASFGTSDARVFTDYHDLLAMPEVDVVHVLTPNNAHCQITIDALDAGKHVLCEKPIAATFAEAQQMVAAAKRSGRKFTIGYQNRFRPDVRYLKNVCVAGELGDIYYSKALAVRRCAVPTWGVFLDKSKQGGGPLIDIGTHAVDITLWMMDNYEVESVMGSVNYKLGKMPNPCNAFGPWDPASYEVEDSAMGFVKFTNGATMIVEASWILNTLMDGEACTVLCGTEGGADMFDGQRMAGSLRITTTRHNRFITTKPVFASGGVDYFGGVGDDDPGVAEAKAWFDCILKDTEPVVKAAEALVVTRILEAIYHSAQTGKLVTF
jgi:predicted dehydrogenase